MVYLFSYANPLLLLVSTAFVVIHGYPRNSADEENGVFGYRPEDGRNVHLRRDPLKNLMARKKRSENDSGFLPENRPKNGQTVVEFLQDSPWAFLALKGGKRRTVNFIPRLGRDSEEEYDGSEDSPYEKSGSRSGNDLSGPFGGGNNFTPRLGRFATLFNTDRYGSTF